MAVENKSFERNDKQKPPELVGGRLFPVLLDDKAWVYAEKGTEGDLPLSLSGDLLKVSPSSATVKRGISPKRGFFRATVVGWAISVRRNFENNISLLASCGLTEANAFNNIFFIDEDRGGISSKRRPKVGGTVSLVESESKGVVIIPVFSKEGQGGILVATVGDLKNPQNIGRINGFLGR